MGTSVESKAASDVKPAKVIFQGHVATHLIDVNEQVRKKFDENAHKELTASILSKGIINPVTLRPMGARYELVAGERRFRAAKAAGLAEIPVTVRELDDQSAALYQVEENVHRRDLTPIEEARGFKLLLEAKKFTVEQLAQLVDKSVPYVYRAVHLLELPKEALESLEAGEITPAHGHQILRVPPADRKSVFNMARQKTAKQLQEQINWNEGEDLANAKFVTKVAYAGEIACTACPYNSGNQGVLFDGAEKGKCLNSKCFVKKTGAAADEYLESVRKKNPSAKFVKKLDGCIYANHSQIDGFQVRCEFDKAPAKGEWALIVASQDWKVFLAMPTPKVKDREQERQEKPADPKVGFIQSEENLALAKALAAKSTKLTKKHLVMLLENLTNNGNGDGDLIQKAIGVGQAEPSKLSESQLCQSIVLHTLTGWQGDIDLDEAKNLGVNIQAVKKAARAAAEKAWALKTMKHMSVANSGSATACGLKGGSYEPDDKVYTAVPDWKVTTCPGCLKKKPKDA